VEVKSFSRELGETRILSFIDGIANTDITKNHVEKMISLTLAASRGETVPEVTWISQDEN